MQIILEGHPIAKKRAKHANRGSFVVTYDPQDKEKKFVRAQMVAFLRDISTQEPIAAFNITESKYLKVVFTFCMPIANSNPNKLRIEKLWGFEFPTSCDIDNLEKFYLDCGNGVLWKDDSRIVEIYSKKIYGQTPYVKIDIEEKRSLTMSKKWAEIIKCFSPNELEIFLYDAYNLGVLYKEEVFHSEDVDARTELLEKIAEMAAIFVANHEHKIKKISKKI